MLHLHLVMSVDMVYDIDHFLSHRMSRDRPDPQRDVLDLNIGNNNSHC